MARGEDLPARVDVVVVGGGVAGLATALYLAEGGVEVLLLEGRGLFGGASGRSAGLVTAGLLDPPHRLAASLGREGTREVLRFSSENSALLRELGVGRWAGCVHAAVGDREAAELARSVEVAVELGLPAELWSAERVNEALGSEGFGPGRYVPGDGVVDPAALRDALAARAGAAGARLAVAAVEDVADDGTVRAGGQRIATELVVLAVGVGAAGVAPWFREKVYPVRGQALSVPAAEVALGWRAQQGYLYGATRGGELVLGGARWATPHLEVGETDDTAVSEAVHEKLLGVLRRHFPALTGPVTRRWSGIQAFTCDGLPFVGQLPGQPRKLACLGFNGRGLALALRSARAVADAALTGRAEGLPACFRPGRMAA